MQDVRRDGRGITKAPCGILVTCTLAGLSLRCDIRVFYGISCKCDEQWPSSTSMSERWVKSINKVERGKVEKENLQHETTTSRKQ